jgi:uncharacterized membrane protein
MYWMHYQSLALPLMLLGLLAVGALVVVLIVGVRPAPSAEAMRILAERLARGEIDEQTYRQRASVLRGSAGG